MSHRIMEDEITARQHELIGSLLRESFPDYPQRSYFKQIPQFRLLDWRDEKLLAHTGVEHRVIRNGDSILRIFGVIDLCVASAERSRGLASRLLTDLESLARSAGVDAIVLVADDSRVYDAAGYSMVENSARWVMINDHETIGIAERPLAGLMVKMLGTKTWQPGLVDFLGYLF